MVVLVPGVPYALDPVAGLWVTSGRPPVPALDATLFVLGVTEPTDANTGVGLDGDPVPTTVVTGSTNTVRGQVVRDRVLDGWVNAAPGSSFVNCLIRGPEVTTGVERPLVNVTGPAVDGERVVLERCTIVPRSPSGWVSGIGMRDYTARRCLIADVVDGPGAAGTAGGPVNVTLEGCRIHRLTQYAPDPVRPSRTETHNDGIQHHGTPFDLSTLPDPYSDLLVDGCSIDARWSPLGGRTSPRANMAAITLSRPVGGQVGIAITRSWLRGGLWSVNATAAMDAAWVRVRGCRLEAPPPGSAPDGQAPQGSILVAASAVRDIPTSGDGVNVYLGSGTVVVPTIV